MSMLGQKLKHELWELIPVTVFFFSAFQLLALTQALMLKQFGIRVCAFLTATVMALIVAKVVLVLFFQIPASNDPDWQPEVANLPYATINGDMITIHNIRNFDNSTETDFDPRWETRTYHLSKLNSADIIAVYWAGKAIAHVMLSFGFDGKEYLAISIETRKERGENYSTLAGFFRQYELYYVVADERDVENDVPPTAGGRLYLPDQRTA
jgi:hypothetical protein